MVIRLSQTIDNLLKNIDISYLFALSIDHGISYKRHNWDLFEPSKFIYAFFTFNMIYDIDWLVTIINNEEEIPAKGITNDRIVKLLEYIYSYFDPNNFKDALLIRLNFKDMLDQTFDIVIDENIEEINKHDKSDNPRLKRSYYLNYKRSVRKLSDPQFTLQDHYNLIVFCYKIRNNIFHGTKTTMEMSAEDQKKRLLTYANIVLTTIDLFFQIIVNETTYTRANIDDLKINAGIKDHVIFEY